MNLDKKTMDAEPLWPTSRDLDRYEHLTGISIGSLLSSGGTWVDIGPGMGALPMRPLLHREDISLKCIGTHKRSLPDQIEFTYGDVPSNLDFLNSFGGKATLVTDIYSSLSYSDDPLLALLYCVMLLKPDGQFGGFTELMRIGELSTWSRTVHFFRSELNTDLFLTALSILEDDSKQVATALRIQAKRGRLTKYCYADLAAKLHESVGTPSIGNVIWQSSDGRASISEINYSKS